MTYAAKRLDRAKMEKLQELEKKLGHCIVAWEKNPGVARLTDEQLKEIQAAEKEMDAILVVYNC